MALVRVSDQLKSIYTHLNQYADMLEGVAGNTMAWLLRVATGENFQIYLADAAGVSKFIIRDSAGTAVFTVDSDGNLEPAGTISLGTIVVPGEAVPTATALGDLRHDEDGFFLTIGTGAATKRLGLVVGAAASPSLTGESAYDTTIKALKVHDGTSSFTLTPVKKYAAATQTISASTAFVDAIAAGTPATFTFSLAANEVWHARYRLRLIFTSTGGAKFQITGPAAPTAVRVTGTFEQQDVYGSADAVRSRFQAFAPATAFSAVVAVRDAAAASINTYNNADQGAFIDIDLFVVNGANAGDVTLQFAQSSAVGTTVMQIGSWMSAERFA